MAKVSSQTSELTYNAELEDLFSPRKPNQECTCSFCRPVAAIHEACAVETKHQPIRTQEIHQSNKYGRVPPLVTKALKTVEDERSVPLIWSPAAELEKRSERSVDEVEKPSTEGNVNSAHGSESAQSSAKQVTCSCSFCAKSFTTTRALELHVRRHSGLRPYPCKFCDKCFYQPSERAVHMRTHTGARPYRCPHCLKLFRYSGDLKQHINIHTGQRPYQCETCLKAFTNHSTLRQHRRIHTGERPYTCEQCGKTYRYHSSLKQHLSAHASKLNQERG